MDNKMIEEFETEPLFIVAIDDAATVLCEQHTKAYVEIMTSLDKELTVIEMLAEDAAEHQCMACGLQDELTRPRIILPH